MDALLISSGPQGRAPLGPRGLHQDPTKPANLASVCTFNSSLSTAAVPRSPTCHADGLAYGVSELGHGCALRSARNPKSKLQNPKWRRSLAQNPTKSALRRQILTFGASRLSSPSNSMNTLSGGPPMGRFHARTFSRIAGPISRVIIRGVCTDDHLDHLGNIAWKPRYYMIHGWRMII